MQEPPVKRKLSNFLIRPLVQTKLGLYSVGLTIAFGVFLSFVLYINLSRFIAYTVHLTRAEATIETMLRHDIASIQVFIYLILGSYIASMVALSIWYTHRLVGPMVAFEKHFEALQNGDFTHRTYLRKADSFHDTAERLNQATETLEARFNASTAGVPLKSTFKRADLVN